MAYRLRKFTFDDLPAMVDVINRAAEADQEDTQTTLVDLRTRFERPYFFPEQNCIIATDNNNKIIGYVTAELDPRFGKGWGTGCVDPAYRRQGIGTGLLNAADARHLECAENDLPPDMGVYVTRYCRDTNTPTRTLYKSAGYNIWLRSLFMHIDLDDTITKSDLPEGIVLRPFERERDAYQVWEIEGELFHDAPGYAQPPFEVWETFMFPVGHDDTLWLVAVDENASEKPIVGICLCHPKHDNPDIGWVELLGVTKAHRGKGLGSIMLRLGFHQMKTYGFKEAELDVDSENKTNAVALYQRAGMQVSRCYEIYMKVIRGTVDV